VAHRLQGVAVGNVHVDEDHVRPAALQFNQQVHAAQRAIAHLVAGVGERLTQDRAAPRIVIHQHDLQNRHNCVTR
jgi:hypothetical protein